MLYIDVMSLLIHGGYDGQFALKSVECFNADQLKWQRLSDVVEYTALL